jgi:16S rRNA (adenine1518-N6/adenine1519-N6)-dimethyltransferase
MQPTSGDGAPPASPLPDPREPSSSTLPAASGLTHPTPGSVPAPTDYDSPKALAAMLESQGFAMQKRFGQNFLVAGAARRRILSLLEAEQGCAAWEVGPGVGAMTWEALNLGWRLSAFEIDHGFAQFVRDGFGAQPGFRLYEGDFIRTWPAAMAEGGRPERVFGNLPYNAAGAIVAALIEGAQAPRSPLMVFTVQKEAAQRMAAKPGTKNYAAFTVLCQSAYQVKLAFDLPPGVFWPQPRVTSSVVVMRALTEPLACAGSLDFTRFTRAAFSSRRKTLRNNLKAAGWTDEALAAAAEKSGLGMELRAEALSPAELAALFDSLPTRR